MSIRVTYCGGGEPLERIGEAAIYSTEDGGFSVYWTGDFGEPCFFDDLFRARSFAQTREIERLTAALQQSVAKECGALCKDLESDRDEWQRRAERAQPVLDAARAVREAESASPYLACTQVMIELIAAVDEFDRCPSCGPGGCAGHTRKPSEVERKLPVCADCGHRHRWGGECADHSWTDSCPYDANGDCEAGQTKAVGES